MDFGKALGALASFFEGEGYRYVAVGAFGLHAYGLALPTTPRWRKRPVARRKSR